MKKNFFNATLIFVFAAAIMLASSCKKDDNEKSNTDKLTGKNLKISGWTIDPPVTIQGNTYTDLWSFLPDCSKDDFMKFNDDGTMIYDEGATKCDPGDPQTENGTWTFTDNESGLKITYEDSVEIYNILELTESKLVATTELQMDFGDGEQTYTSTLTFLAN